MSARRVRTRGRSRRWRQVRLRYDGDEVVLSGAVRARIGEQVLDVVWRRGADRDAAIERFLRHVRLPSVGAERLRAERRRHCGRTTNVVRNDACWCVAGRCRRSEPASFARSSAMHHIRDPRRSGRRASDPLCDQFRISIKRPRIVKRGGGGRARKRARMRSPSASRWTRVALMVGWWAEAPASNTRTVVRPAGAENLMQELLAKPFTDDREVRHLSGRK